MGGDQGGGISATRTVEIVAAHTTTHLPPSRAVVTTPALIALIEESIAQAEAEVDAAGGWISTSAGVRHRAGLRCGELATVAVRCEAGQRSPATWTASVTASDGRLVAEATLERRLERRCQS